MKHYVGAILERNGDLEYHTKFILQVQDGEDLDQACTDVAMRWRGGDATDWDEMLGGYWCDGSLIFPFEPRSEPSPEDLAVLRKYLNVLTSDGE